MAIRCPRCGLEYDVALFAFGRTLDCTCGERVRLAHAHRAGSGNEPRFLADGMLMGLARWLRMLGHDTVCDPGLGRAAMVRRCYEEGRTLLTRDRKLERAWSVPHLYLVRAETPLAQLEEVASRYGLRVDERLFTRCSRCNVALEPLEPRESHEVRPSRESGESLEPLVSQKCAAEPPADVSRRHETMRRCPSCGRYYWEGSHVARMRQVLADRVARGT